MKFRKTDFAFIAGVSLIVGPIVFGWPVGVVWYLGAIVGVVLLALAGYDAQARMLKMGSPGEDFLDRLWACVRRSEKK